MPLTAATCTYHLHTTSENPLPPGVHPRDVEENEDTEDNDDA